MIMNKSLRMAIGQNGGTKKAKLMVVSDLDNTMVDHSDPQHGALRRFNDKWSNQLASDGVLVFSTGRSPHKYHQLRKEAPLLHPDVLVCSVGTEILIRKRDEQGNVVQNEDENAYDADEEWVNILNEGWDRAKVESEASKIPELTPQESSEQRPHKLSYRLYADNPQQVVDNINKSMKDAGINCNVIFSGGYDLDILAGYASKGHALDFLIKQAQSLDLRPTNILACGDSGNDTELFTVPDVYGCIVSNAKDELKQWGEQNRSDHINMATARCADGILESIAKYNFDK